MFPNLSRLTVSTGTEPVMRTRAAARRAREEALNMPEDLWKLVMEKANENLDRPYDICQEMDARCRVAKTTPWGQNACGEYGWMYDQANQQMGFYRDYPDWNAFQAWIAANPQHLHPDHLSTRADWWTKGPKTYFRKCCAEWFGIVLEKLDNTYDPFDEDFYPLPWARAFLEKELRDHPWRFGVLGQVNQCPDYLYLAKVVMGIDPDQLRHVAGALHWDGQDYRIHMSTHIANVNNHGMFSHFVELAKIAIARDGRAFRFVPGALKADGMHASGTPIPEFVELARIAVQSDGRALKYVPGTPTMWGDRQVAEPIPEFVELAKLAVRNDPYALQYVPGAMMRRPNGTEMRSANAGVTEEDFVQIVKGAVERFGTRVLTRNVPYHLIPRVREE